MALEGVGEIDVEDLLNELGLEHVDAIGRGEVQFSCPFTDGHAFGDMHPSAHMSQDKPGHPYRCKGCGRAGTALDMVGAVLRLSPVEATRWLRQRYGDAFRPLEGGTIAAEMRAVEERRAARQEKKLRLPHDDETIGPRGIFTIDWRSNHEAAVYMRERGFTPETLDLWHLGFDGWTNRVTIPIRDESSRLVGFKGRALDPHADPRYLLLGDTEDRKPRYGMGYGFDMHDPINIVFGLDRAALSQAHLQRRRLVVCEGELNALALQQAGVVNAVAIGTTTITKPQQQLLRWYADELVLFYDTDKAGQAASWGYFDPNGNWRPGVIEKLSPYMAISVVPEHEGDPAGMGAKRALELLSQAESWLAIATS